VVAAHSIGDNPEALLGTVEKGMRARTLPVSVRAALRQL